MYTLQSMNTAALDTEAFWDNVWDDKKKQFIIDIIGRSLYNTGR